MSTKNPALSGGMFALILAVFGWIATLILRYALTGTSALDLPGWASGLGIVATLAFLAAFFVGLLSIFRNDGRTLGIVGTVLSAAYIGLYIWRLN